jgi:hypothetical protein
MSARLIVLPSWMARWDRESGDGLSFADDFLQKLLDQRRRGEIVGSRRRYQSTRRRRPQIRGWRANDGGRP